MEVFNKSSVTVTVTVMQATAAAWIWVEIKAQHWLKFETFKFETVQILSYIYDISTTWATRLWVRGAIAYVTPKNGSFCPCSASRRYARKINSSAGT